MEESIGIGGKELMTYKYKRIDTSTLAGLKKAEWYKARGWKIISTGFYTIVFEKAVIKKDKLQ